LKKQLNSQSWASLKHFSEDESGEMCLALPMTDQAGDALGLWSTKLFF
jgi:hypothetical protein